jgi:predicted TIM-barrel fold metal-dependent hydrolase
MSDASFPPKGACDCHVHVIGPKHRFPLAAERTYTPRDAVTAELAAMLERLALDRVVLVQPSIYGVDNACMMDAIAALGDRARGVAVLRADTPAHELDRLHAAGVRGLRVNVASVASLAIEKVRADLVDAAALAERNGWHVQTFLPSAAIALLSDAFLALPAPVVIDHFGLVDPHDDEAAATPLLRLLESGRIWVKLSGTYRIADDPSDPAIAPLARRLAAVNPERVVWGSDWPHTPAHGHAHVASDVEQPYRDLDTRALLIAVGDWFDDPSTRQRVLVDNPARLYGFT